MGGLDRAICEGAAPEERADRSAILSSPLSTGANWVGFSWVLASNLTYHLSSIPYTPGTL